MSFEIRSSFRFPVVSVVYILAGRKRKRFGELMSLFKNARSLSRTQRRISQDLCAANERKPTERDLHNKRNVLAHITEVEVTIGELCFSSSNDTTI